MSAEGQPASPTASHRYADAVNDAFERLAGHGPEWGRRGFAFHAPMAAEALAALGYYDDVPQWIERNRHIRAYSAPPEPRRPLDPNDQADLLAARGDISRVADWAKMFNTELASRPWQEVLAAWWPRLAPGLAAALGHGMIRTAHAVRVLRSVAEPTPAQLGELSRGLAYWAARYWSPPAPMAQSPLAAAAALTPAPEQAHAALMDATATAAGILADRAPMPTIPLIHMVTIPAAIDMVLPVLPLELHPDTYRFAVNASAMVLQNFGSHLRTAVLPADAPVPTLTQSIEAAVELGDEHAIKLAEVCVRSAVAHPDNEPYLRAVAILIYRLSNGQATIGLE